MSDPAIMFIPVEQGGETPVCSEALFIGSTEGSAAKFELLASLLRYPDDSYHGSLETARVAFPIDPFCEAVRGLGIAHLQAIYTNTFDLAPSCSPYLGVHLFGDEGRERAALMLGLRSGGVAADGRELPDHVAEVLAHAGRFDGEEWADLRELVLKPALAKMEVLLASTPNPYRHLVAAIRNELGGEK
jgi:nitrate reductase assembly molybdenum cofactor insertion protein NarJ